MSICLHANKQIQDNIVPAKSDLASTVFIGQDSASDASDESEESEESDEADESDQSDQSDQSDEADDHRAVA